MNSSFYITAAVVVVTSVVMGYLAKSVSGEIKPNPDGRYLMQMHKTYKIGGYAAIVLGVIIAACIFLLDPVEWMGVTSILGLFVLFAGLGTICVLYFRNHHVLFNEEQVEVKSVFGSTGFFKWEDVVGAKLNKTSGDIVLKVKDGQKFRVHQHLRGINHFLATLENKTNISVNLDVYN